MTVAVILFGAPPGWTQNEGAGPPAPDNVLQMSGFNGAFSRWMRPPTAEAASRNPQKQRVRAAKVRKPVEAPEPATPAWPNAQISAGTGAILPVVVKTVREMAEPQSDSSLVHENELSDLDMIAKPLPEAPAETTDGRASGDEVENRETRFAAIAESVKSVGNASWFEALLLAMAGALAAVTAMRVFARS